MQHPYLVFAPRSIEYPLLLRFIQMTNVLESVAGMPHSEEQCLVHLQKYSEGDPSYRKGVFPRDGWQPVIMHKGLGPHTTAFNFSLIFSRVLVILSRLIIP